MSDYQDYLACLRDVPLTPSEQDILLLVANGATPKEVGTQKGITRSTVYGHLEKIAAKLGTKTRAHATNVAIRNGILIFVLTQNEDGSDTFVLCRADEIRQRCAENGFVLTPVPTITAYALKDKA